VLIETFILAMMAISYNLLFGFAGVVSFGHAAFFGVGAYTAGVLTLKFGWAWGPAILATLVFGLLIALIMGVVGLRLKGLYFAMFTLAFAEVLFLLASNRIMTDITGAEDGLIYEVPEFLNATTNRLFVYYLVLALMIASFILVRRLMHSPTGRVLSAIRDNENRAQMLGYNTFHFKLIAMLLSGLIATLSGLLLGIVNKGANAPLLGVGVTVDALLQTIIGGLGTFAGPVVGAFGLHLLEFLLRDLKVPVGETTLDIGTNWALFLGAIFILAVLAFPQGIVGTIQSRRLNTLDGWLRWLRLRRT
jgi:branched-chain amino acid transport system permease protein